MLKPKNFKRVPSKTRKLSAPAEVKSSQIPTYASDAVQSLKVRYYNVETTTSSMTIELPIAPYGYSVTSSSIAMPFKAVRLKSVEMWCNYTPGAGVANNTINLTVVDRRTVRPIEWSDTATFTTPAHIKKKFSKFEPLGLWYSTSIGETNPELTFQVPKEGVVEIVYDFIISDGSAVPTYNTGGGLTTNRLYTNLLNASFAPIGKVNAAYFLM